MAGPEGSAPPLDAQDMQLMEDHLARQAADAARSRLERDAVTSNIVTIEAGQKAGGFHVDIPPLGEYGSTQTTDRVGGGKIKVTEHSARRQSLSDIEGDDLMAQVELPGDSRARTTTTESVAPAKGLGILGRPDMEKATTERVSVITSSKGKRASDITRERTPDGDIVDGTDTTVEETVNGKRRIVHRTITTGRDKNDKTVIKVQQRSTDLEGGNERSREWVHTDEDPSKVGRLSTGTEIDQAKAARKMLKGVGGRVVSAQKDMGGPDLQEGTKPPRIPEAAIKAADEQKAYLDSQKDNPNRFQL